MYKFFLHLRLMNKISPGSIRKINKSKSPIAYLVSLSSRPGVDTCYTELVIIKTYRMQNLQEDNNAIAIIMVSILANVYNKLWIHLSSRITSSSFSTDVKTWG